MAKLSFAKALSAKNILTPHINSYLEKGEFPDEWVLKINPNKEKDDAFHPSGDCVPCARELYLKHAGMLTGRKHDSTSHKNFNVGHFWHLWLGCIVVDGLGFAQWEDVEKKCGYAAETWWATGSADIAKCTIPSKGEFLVDWKTMNSRIFAMEADNPMLANILHKYELQVNCYMAWTGMDRCIIVGIEKDTPHSFREFVYEYNPDLLEPVYDKWDAVAAALRSGVEPECDCDDCPVLSV